MDKYDPMQIEAKWQKKWEEEDTFKAREDSLKTADGRPRAKMCSRRL